MSNLPARIRERIEFLDAWDAENKDVPTIMLLRQAADQLATSVPTPEQAADESAAELVRELAAARDEISRLQAELSEAKEYNAHCGDLDDEIVALDDEVSRQAKLIGLLEAERDIARATLENIHLNLDGHERLTPDQMEFKLGVIYTASQVSTVPESGAKKVGTGHESEVDAGGLLPAE